MIGIGLLFLHASIWQMLRRLNIIIATVIQAAMLKRKIDCA
jgi:hypothetical protein